MRNKILTSLTLLTIFLILSPVRVYPRGNDAHRPAVGLLEEGQVYGPFSSGIFPQRSDDGGIDEVYRNPWLSVSTSLRSGTVLCDMCGQYVTPDENGKCPSSGCGVYLSDPDYIGSVPISDCPGLFIWFALLYILYLFRLRTPFIRWLKFLKT
ncbi:hypothetical protein LJB91_02355 [Bacteroidales bacterium OttesenSCG-928-L03]|nr:hypothetical protein [Bacteroidales bacterium OttesenSCG-928-L03]